jgi:hypothetical protein
MGTTNRRSFLKTVSAAGAGIIAVPHISKAGTTGSKKAGQVNIAFIGVGGRGRGHVQRAAVTEGVKVTAFCDIDPEAVSETKKLLSDLGKPEAAVYSDGEYAFLEMLKRDDIDGVIIATPWLWHTRMAVATMKAGKYVAVEVSAANTMENAGFGRYVEETGIPCMILENVNYRRDVMAVTNMSNRRIRRSGPCPLWLPSQPARCKIQRSAEIRRSAEGEARWRTQHSLKSNADVYPTHGLGPCATCSISNRGNRFLYLTSTATKAVVLKDYIEEKGGKDQPYAQTPWIQGDIFTSIIKPPNGETILVTHDCNLPRQYSLDFMLPGPMV